MRSSRYWLMVLLLLGLLTAAGYFALQSRLEAGKDLPEYSVFSDEENGLAKAAQVLRQIGFRPVALTRPMQHTQHRGLLIMVSPRQMTLFGALPGLSENNGKGLLNWVEKGNTLVLLTRYVTPVHQELDVDLIGDFGETEVNRKIYQAEAVEIGGYTEPVDGQTVRVQSLAVEGKDTVQGTRGVPLWYVGDRPGAWLVPHGAGQVLVVADPSLWTHRGLARRDNVLLLYNIARLTAVDGRVFFDEYHHGIRSGGGYWDYLRYHNLHWLALQLLLVVGIAVWTVGVRLGPARATPASSRADAVDYASAVARIYQRAGVHHLLAQHLVRDFLENLTRHLHLRRNTPPAELIKTCRLRHGAERGQELAELLKMAERMSDVNNPHWRFRRRELLHWARAFDGFIKTISD
jgi:hypothetical protein